MPSSFRARATSCGRGVDQLVATWVARLDRLEVTGEGLLPYQGGEAVRRQVVVPTVAALEQLPEHHALGCRRMLHEVEPHVLQGRAVLGLDVNLPGALDNVVREVDVIDEVLCGGHHLPVARGAGDNVLDAKGHVLALIRTHDPDAAHARRKPAHRLINRHRVAHDSAIPVGREDGQILVKWCLLVLLVEELLRGRLELALCRVRCLRDLAAVDLALAHRALGHAQCIEGTQVAAVQPRGANRRAHAVVASATTIGRGSAVAGTGSRRSRPSGQLHSRTDAALLGRLTLRQGRRRNDNRRRGRFADANRPRRRRRA